MNGNVCVCVCAVLVQWTVILRQCLTVRVARVRNVFHWRRSVMRRTTAETSPMKPRSSVSTTVSHICLRTSIQLPPPLYVVVAVAQRWLDDGMRPPPSHLKSALLHGGSGPTSNTWFLGPTCPTWVHIPNDVLIGSAIFAGLKIVTDMPCCSLHL